MKLNTQALSEVTTRTPVIQPGPYFVRIKQMTLKPQKANPDANNLNIVLEIGDSEVKGQDGKTYKNNSNLVLFDRMSLTLTDTYNPNIKLKEINEACGIATDDFETDAIVGQWVKVLVKYQPARTDKGEHYDESNVIGRYIRITDADKFNPPAF